MTSLDELLLIRGQYRYIRKNAIQDFRNSNYVVPFTTEITFPGGTGPQQLRKVYSKGFGHTGSSTITSYYANDPDYVPFLIGSDTNNETLVENANNNRIRLVDTYNVYDNDIIAPYKSSFSIPPAPLIESNEAAAQMLEVYAMALLRDVPMSVVQNPAIANPYLSDIVTALNNVNTWLKAPTSPPVGGSITRNLLFRLDTEGDRLGPYASQFLYYTILFSNYLFVQNQYLGYDAPFINNPTSANINFNNDYIKTRAEFVTVWNGEPPSDTFSKGSKLRRYLTTIRDFAIYINKDQIWQMAYMAATLLLAKNVKIGFFASDRLGTKFINLGPVDLYDIMGKAGKLGMNTTWLWKYKQLRVRPEEMAYQIDLTISTTQPTVPGLNFPSFINTSNNILSKVSTAWTQTVTSVGTPTPCPAQYLLSQVFKTGSPFHPSLPSGHATYGGAMMTILKAWFNCDYYMEAYEPDLATDPSGTTLGPYGATGTNDRYLKVRNEIDKLASNCAFFRNFAGVHYRGDSDAGIELGEQVAIELLKDIVKKYSGNVGFRFNKRNGELVTIKNFDEPIPVTETYFNPNTGQVFPSFYSTSPDVIIDNAVDPNSIASGDEVGDPSISYQDYNQT